jgi:hypothetical protein
MPRFLVSLIGRFPPDYGTGGGLLLMVVSRPPLSNVTCDVW